MVYSYNHLELGILGCYSVSANFRTFFWGLSIPNLHAEDWWLLLKNLLPFQVCISTAIVTGNEFFPSPYCFPHLCKCISLRASKVHLKPCWQRSLENSILRFLALVKQESKKKSMGAKGHRKHLAQATLTINGERKIGSINSLGQLDIHSQNWNWVPAPCYTQESTEEIRTFVRRKCYEENTGKYFSSFGVGKVLLNKIQKVLTIKEIINPTILKLRTSVY